MFGFVQNLPPRYTDLMAICNPLCSSSAKRTILHIFASQNALFYIFSPLKTHYFTYFRLPKRTILQIFVSKNALFYNLTFGFIKIFCLHFCKTIYTFAEKQKLKI